jgi:hypothetical protein
LEEYLFLIWPFTWVTKRHANYSKSLKRIQYSTRS